MRKLIRTLVEAESILKDVQVDLEKDLKQYEFYESLNFKYSTENFVLSFKKNFFTILMLSLIKESGVSKKNCISYGKIILLLRQVVTSVDNILDKERKGLIFIDKIRNLKVENSLLILLSQELLTYEIIKLKGQDETLKSVLLERIYSIAQGESLRDIKLYKTYPTSEYIFENVHRQIGGELLELSLVIPKMKEQNLKLNKFSKGLFEIGLSLQGLDDFFDMKEDFEEGNINLATAKYIEDFKVEVENIDFENLDSKFVAKYVKDVIEIAYNGFSILEKAGFPISEKESKFILKSLFKLRGLSRHTCYIN